jgi:mersacidin/lichenicidin family type 2 lantibiotic
MSTANIIRAWKDENYRSSLSGAELTTLPLNPAGVSALSGFTPAQASGGFYTFVECPTNICTLARCATVVQCPGTIHPNPTQAV